LKLFIIKDFSSASRETLIRLILTPRKLLVTDSSEVLYHPDITAKMAGIAKGMGNMPES